MQKLFSSRCRCRRHHPFASCEKGTELVAHHCTSSIIPSPSSPPTPDSIQPQIVSWLSHIYFLEIPEVVAAWLLLTESECHRYDYHWDRCSSVFFFRSFAQQSLVKIPGNNKKPRPFKPSITISKFISIVTKSFARVFVVVVLFFFFVCC